MTIFSIVYLVPEIPKLLCILLLSLLLASRVPPLSVLSVFFSETTDSHGLWFHRHFVSRGEVSGGSGFCTTAVYSSVKGSPENGDLLAKNRHSRKISGLNDI